MQASVQKSSDDWLPVWPSEEAPAQLVDEYFKIGSPLVVIRGYDYDLRGETHPSLLLLMLVYMHLNWLPIVKCGLNLS